MGEEGIAIQPRAEILLCRNEGSRADEAKKRFAPGRAEMALNHPARDMQIKFSDFLRHIPYIPDFPVWLITLIPDQRPHFGADDDIVAVGLKLRLGHRLPSARPGKALALAT